MKIEIDQKQLANLIQFLNRVQLVGFDEANALMEIFEILRKSGELNNKEAK